LASGAERVVPLLDVEETFRQREKFPDTVLGGERGGKRIDGFDLGNSPKSFTPEVVAGKTVLFTTTNGTVAMHAARFAEPIFLACFMNAAAVVDVLSRFERISIVCAGTDGKPTEEDILLAGCLTERLQRHSGYAYRLNVQATTAVELWNRSFSLTRIIGEEKIPTESLAQILRTSRGGSNLMKIGMDDDILTASELDSIDLVPQMRDGAIVRS
jgi:2-phosphosulfolactate phosphatase